jgi:hypothetical protein
MNIRNILSEIEKTDPEVYEKLSDRRDVLKNFGAKVALAAMPLAVGSLFKKAYGKTTDAVTDIFNLAIELKFLQYNFYHMGDNTGGLIPAADLPGFLIIENQEKAQIQFLSGVVSSMGAVPYTPRFYSATALNPYYVPAAYDFTAGGTYSPFDHYSVFLQLAQMFEDTSVHAIKGQIPAVLGNADILGQLMELQCAEARHASHVRLIRRMSGTALEYPAPWITNNIPPSIATQNYYVGEDNVTQLNVTTTLLPDDLSRTGNVPQVSATAAFDEPYEKATILSLIAPFLR